MMIRTLAFMMCLLAATLMLSAEGECVDAPECRSEPETQEMVIVLSDETTDVAKPEESCRRCVIAEHRVVAAPVEKAAAVVRPARIRHCVFRE